MATPLMFGRTAMQTKSFAIIPSSGNRKPGVEARQPYVGLRKSVTLRSKSPCCQRASQRTEVERRREARADINKGDGPNQVINGASVKPEYYADKPPTPLLDTINYPIHLKNLNIKDLEQVADELRTEIIFTVSKTGGHLGSGLGVVDLTVALHHVFNAPEDRVLWDVGHQTYPHKILTGRRSKMHTIRQTRGLAGFTKRSESEYDPFGAGHSSTTISAGLGMAVARDIQGKSNSVVAVIGDGAMTAGQAYEAMNNAGYLDSNLIVILNDNNQVSLPTATLEGPAPPVGALSGALSKLQSSRTFVEGVKEVTMPIGASTHQLASEVGENTRRVTGDAGSTLFEDLGLGYCKI